MSLDQSDIYGRNEIIERIWSVLGKKSIYMNDLRRIGKTMILEKMKANSREGWLVIKRDLGKCHTAEEFAAQVYSDALTELGNAKGRFLKMKKILGENLGGFEMKGIKLPDGRRADWKEVLNNTFSDLDRYLGQQDKKLLFLWDELPFLLDNIIKNPNVEQGEYTAMEILDVLRSLRQDYRNVKMVLTGSIGLHHILAVLQQSDYINSPLNDMKSIAPGPMNEEEGLGFAKLMLTERKIKFSNNTAKKLATLVGNVPYYIENLVDSLREDSELKTSALKSILDEKLVDPDDHWDLPHYRTRLKRYKSRQNLAQLTLNCLSKGKAMKSVDHIMEAINDTGESIEKKNLIEVLDLLNKDHYLKKSSTGKWGFRLALVQRWWKLNN